MLELSPPVFLCSVAIYVVDALLAWFENIIICLYQR